MTTPAPRVFLPVPGALHVALTYDVNGQPAVVVLGAYNGGNTGPTSSVLQAMAHRFHELARPLMATSCTLTNITARQAVPDGQVIGLALPATNLTGTAAGNLVTAYATLVRWNTAQGGRSGRGRNYVPGFTTGGMNADGRTLSSTFLTAANALVTGMTATSEATDPFSIISRTDGVANQVTSGSVASIVGVQRRRLRN